MREKLHKLNDIFSWVLLIAMSMLLVFSLYSVKNAPKGEGAFLFGYRPVFVLTGSMEPYMMTNGMCLTEKVDSLDDIAVGDVVTFHVEGDNGKLLRITHRIISIDNGIINTKGDNNRVSDDIPLSIDNIEAKVIFVFNQSAWIIQKWGTTSGKIMIISFALAIVLGYYAIKSFIKLMLCSEKDKETIAERVAASNSEDEDSVSSEKKPYQPKYLKNRKK